MSSRPDGDEKRKSKQVPAQKKNLLGYFGHIHADTFFAYLDRSLKPDEEKIVLSHLHQCERCRNELKESYTVLKGLNKYAEKNRKECPSPEMMRNLEIGKLSESEIRAIKKHLSECPRCIEFADLYKRLEQEYHDKG
jgi:predicted anti-sigma-YlaC factor YlaD